MTEIRLLGSILSTIDPNDLHGYNPEADTGHLLVQLPDRMKKIVLFEAVYLNFGLRFTSVYKKPQCPGNWLYFLFQMESI
jgi:hypothetical protein